LTLVYKVLFWLIQHLSQVNMPKSKSWVPCQKKNCQLNVGQGTG